MPGKTAQPTSDLTCVRGIFAILTCEQQCLKVGDPAVFTEAGEAEQRPHGGLSSAFTPAFLCCLLPFVIG